MRLDGGLDEIDSLLDQVDGDGLRRDFDAQRVLEHLVGELLDVGRHRRGEQQRLPLLGHHRHDLADVANETHVEHAVGFVEHQMGDMAKIDMALLGEIEQASRRGDEDVDAARQRLDLGGLADAAQNDGVPEARMPPVGGEAVADLHGELARRREDQRTHRLGRERLLRLRQMLQDRQRERRRLAGARLRDAEKIAAFEQGRNGARLDRRGRGVVFGRKRAAERLGDAELGESLSSHSESPYAPARPQAGRWSG